MTNDDRTHIADDPGRADALVMFGLTGDLGEKKLFPALGELAVAGELTHPVVAVSRSGVSVEELRERIAGALAASALDDGGFDAREAERAVAALDLRAVQGGVDEGATWHRIVEAVDGCERPVVYAALPPSLFATTATRVAGTGLPDTTRLVVEKPFGEDHASAMELWHDVTDQIDPARLFVVDHFLAKTVIENLLTVRARNAVIANNLLPGLVERIDVVLHESGDVDGRGSFYESVGAVRDVVQNHLLQMLAVATMQRPPDGTDAAYLRARQDALEAIRPVDPATVTLGQYSGYRELDDVADDSDVETFASLELAIDADPWRGIPVGVVTGKALHEQRTAVVFTIRSDAADGRGRIVFDVSPSPCISIELDVIAGDDQGTRAITLAGHPDDDHEGLGDYATMLRGALRGERRHFATIDGILASWRVVDPIAEHRPDIELYEPGTDGPKH